MIRSGLSWNLRMAYRNSMIAILILSFGSLLAGCGGGSGGADAVIGGGGGSSTLAPSFNSSQTNPAPDMVSMASVVVLGDELTVSVDVTETDRIASASLEVTFDPAYVEFVDWSCGELLPPCGAGTLAALSDESPGRLVFGLAKIFADTGEDAFGTETLLRFTFRAVQAGASPLGFDSDSSALLDPDLIDIPGITWHGGTIVIN